MILSFIGAFVLGFCFENDPLQQLLQQMQAFAPYRAVEAQIESRSLQRKQSLVVAMRQTFAAVLQ
jgi:hypothetical protein